MGYSLRLSIFCFRRIGGELEYLFARQHPLAEFDWSPIHAAIRPEDTVTRAALRQMHDEWGAPDPHPLIDLNTFDRAQFGDEELIDCAIGYGVVPDWRPELRYGDRFDLVWATLPRGFQILPAEDSRRALFRLHLAAQGIS